MAKAKTCVITSSGKRVCGRPTTGASGAAARRPASQKPSVMAMKGDSRYSDVPVPMIVVKTPRLGDSNAAMILGHRIAADVLAATGSNRWGVSLRDDGGDAGAIVSIETMHETPAEIAAAMAVLNRVAAKYQK